MPASTSPSPPGGEMIPDLHVEVGLPNITHTVITGRLPGAVDGYDIKTGAADGADASGQPAPAHNDIETGVVDVAGVSEQPAPTHSTDKVVGGNICDSTRSGPNIASAPVRAPVHRFSSPAAEEDVCFICLDDTAPLIKDTCACKTTQVHIHCLEEWATKQNESMLEESRNHPHLRAVRSEPYKVDCPVCKVPYKLDWTPKVARLERARRSAAILVLMWLAFGGGLLFVDVRFNPEGTLVGTFGWAAATVGICAGAIAKSGHGARVVLRVRQGGNPRRRRSDIEMLPHGGQRVSASATAPHPLRPTTA
ncbi:hypothetical protein T492DRAFT_859106 [Pavlovales sp. CCMP2436]|nr:hypothetical protein T492DRAFT_859106 [Pavlovales sp. CCMP2436]